MHRKLSRIEAIIAKSPVAQLMQRHKRQHDMQLYRVLSDCLAISEICLKDPEEYEVLNGLIKKLPMVEGKTRQYVEKSSDIYQRVCRFMFHGEEHNANTNRYAHALREAANQGVKSGELTDQLCNGGINRFYLVRPSQSTRERIVRTKCLRLEKQIQHYKSDKIVLTLKRNAEGFYAVLKQTSG